MSRMILVVATIGTLAAAALAAWQSPVTTETPPERFYSDAVLSAADKNCHDLVVSADRTQIACVFSSGERSQRRVAYHGKEAGPYDFVRLQRFSPDGKRFAYLMDRFDEPGALSVVVNDRIEGPYDEAHSVVFSGDSTRVAYAAKTDGRWFVISDFTSRLGPYKEVKELGFSPDSRRFAFAARVEGDWTIVVDGKPAGAYRDIQDVVFSPDSRRLAFAARTKAWSVVVDGVSNGSYADMPDASIVFGPDSTRLAYVAKLGSKWVTVVDGTAAGPYDEVLPHYSVDIARSETDLAVLSHGQLEYTMRNFAYGSRDRGMSGQRFAEPPVRFSVDGKLAAYIVQVDKKECVIVEARREPCYDRVSWLTLSETGVAYVGVTGDKSFVVHDGKADGPYDRVLRLVFRPGSNQLAYAVGSKEHASVSVEAGPRHDQPELNEIFDLRFSPSGRRLAYAARVRPPVDSPSEPGRPKLLAYTWRVPADSRTRFEGRWQVFVDGQGGVEHEGVVYGRLGSWTSSWDAAEYDYFDTRAVVVFSSDDKFHYLALRRDGINLVEETFLRPNAAATTSLRPSRAGSADEAPAVPPNAASGDQSRWKASHVHVMGFQTRPCTGSLYVEEGRVGFRSSAGPDARHNWEAAIADVKEVKEWYKFGSDRKKSIRIQLRDGQWKAYLPEELPADGLVEILRKVLVQ